MATQEKGRGGERDAFLPPGRKGQKVKRSKGQKVKRSKGQKVKRSKGQKVKSDFWDFPFFSGSLEVR